MDYEPHTEYAHDMMQAELEETLLQYGEVKKTPSDNGHTYEVYKGKELLGKVHYNPGSDQVVEAEDKLLEKVREYFIEGFEENFKKHEENYKSKAQSDEK